MCVDDIPLCKPISSHEDYSILQTDIGAVQDCISTSHLQLLNLPACQLIVSPENDVINVT